MKVLFGFKLFVFLSTNALATEREDRFISTEFVVNSVFVYDPAMVHVIVSFMIFGHDITRPRPFQDMFCHFVCFPRVTAVLGGQGCASGHPRPVLYRDRRALCRP